jgi:hypothetical protein
MSTASCKKGSSDSNEVRNLFAVFIVDNGSVWNGKDEIFARDTIFAIAITLVARCRLAMWRVMEIQECCY